ncbi:hypothetical protein BC834DRAFT_261636 [Gloeopeniophorella convolvens]|nr:hypothetical protein BC834DRAFT_261636 [Gloeopeniophorella convolvens]
MTTVQNTIGTIFAGALLACALSGVLAVQVFLYHRRYPNDRKLYKIMVWCFWVIDTIQTTSLAVCAWNYAIRHLETC